MGNSTISIQDVIDTIASRGNVNPVANPSGYNVSTAVSIANDVIGDLIHRDFNFKWNSILAKPFLTTPWQQDYPQIGITNIGWLEGGWWLQINSTSRPIPSDTIEEVRELPYASMRSGVVPAQMAWAYNRELSYGAWPSAAFQYVDPRGTNVAPANGPTAILDTNGNILTLTTFGITGAQAPALPAGSPEGATVSDGGCVWTVCSPDSQGFRLDSMPAAGSPVLEIHVKYQKTAPKYVNLTDLIDPVPDDFAPNFRRGYSAYANDYSPDPKAQSAFPALHQAWLQSMADAMNSSDRESSSYSLLPATYVTSRGAGAIRDPRDPRTPY